MFTGLIEEIGTVRHLTGGSAPRLAVGAHTVLEGTQEGDSIAVNGVCLTVVAIDAAGFTVEVMPETLRATNLGRLRAGQPVNLERALTLASRLGGHLVQGHVDAVGEVVQKQREANALWVTVRAPQPILRYVAPRGFVALDGASLTVARLEQDRFAVSLVPHTQAHITLPQQPLGYAVNLEVDVVAKYVERLLHAGRQDRQAGTVDEALLARQGFL